MLDDFKDKQNIVYNMLMNQINNNKVSHAYLFNENDNNESFDIVMAFIKEVLVHNLDDNNKKILCKRIDDGNYPEIKIISPDGMLIKKKQIIDLQQEFSMVAVEGSKRVYVIRNADAMRGETANSMLKFLEEPDNNILAILMTNNFNAILPTIVSRCQVIRLNNADSLQLDDEIDHLCLNFIQNIEKYGVRTIINEQNLLFDVLNLKDREKYINFFDKLIDMYYDIMKINICNLDIKFKNYFDELNEIALKNVNDLLIKKINFLMEKKDAIKYNVNMNLLIDSVIVGVGGMQ